MLLERKDTDVECEQKQQKVKAMHINEDRMSRRARIEAQNKNMWRNET